jgi:hypothetical protein
MDQSNNAFQVSIKDGKVTSPSVGCRSLWDNQEWLGRLNEVALQEIWASVTIAR